MSNPDIQTERTHRFSNLVATAQACRLCPRMEGRRRVLGRDNGSLSAAVLFVAEAPGRLGAERSGIPLQGDASGRNFAAFLASIGWQREDVFITNAVLCNPRDAAGRNAAPSRREIANCAGWLQATIDVLQPRLVVPLGAVALRALHAIAPHDLTLHDVATALQWYDRWLFPLYHPGPRALIHRRYEQQLRDYSMLAQFCLQLHLPLNTKS